MFSMFLIQVDFIFIICLKDYYNFFNSKIDDFKEGGPYCPLVGNEVSINFAKCEGNPDYFFKYEELVLSEDETKQLEATYAAFKANYKCVGTLY